MSNSVTNRPWVYSTGAVYLAEPKDRAGFPCVCLATRDSDEAAISPTEKDEALRLMAAAPALLAFVEKWRTIIDCGKGTEGWAREFDKEARSALAAARGGA